jgi:hypothetical protein
MTDFLQWEFTIQLFNFSIFLYQFYKAYHKLFQFFFHPSSQQFAWKVHRSKVTFLILAFQYFGFFQSFFNYSFFCFKHIGSNPTKIVKDP